MKQDKFEASLERLEKLMNDPVFLAKLDQEALVKKNQLERVEKFINSLSEEQFHEWLKTFLAWEREYEEFRYTEKNEHSSSIIFDMFIKVAQKQGREVKSLRELFLYQSFKWRGYNFKLFCGQGSFWRILKGRKQIFQNT